LNGCRWIRDRRSAQPYQPSRRFSSKPNRLPSTNTSIPFLVPPRLSVREWRPLPWVFRQRPMAGRERDETEQTTWPAADVLARRPTPEGPSLSARRRSAKLPPRPRNGGARARQVSPGCPPPRAEAAKARDSHGPRRAACSVLTCGMARARRQPRTVRAGPGRRSEARSRRARLAVGAGGGGEEGGRSVGGVGRAGSGRRGTTSAPEAGRNASDESESARPARPRWPLSDALIPPRRLRPRLPTRGPASVASGRGRRDRQGALASASCAPSLETRAIWIFFLIEHVDVVTCKVAKPPSTTDGHDETTTAL